MGGFFNNGGNSGGGGGGGSGDVTGPNSSTPEEIAIFDDTTGKKIENSVVKIEPNGEIDGAILDGGSSA